QEAACDDAAGRPAGPALPAPRSREVTRVKNPLPALERWKIIDNLRRSLVAPSLLLLLLLGWALPGRSFWFWTAFAVVVLALPLLFTLLSVLLGIVHGGSLLLHLRDARKRLKATAGQMALTLCFLVEQARQALDAIARTLGRLHWRQRNLLEWETAATTERRLGTGFRAFWVAMWLAPVLASATALALGVFHPAALLTACPFLLAWFVSPAVAYAISRPGKSGETPLSLEDRAELRGIARKTWSFFETFVGLDDHWLPPDNYQQDPKGAVAHRTSPTNMGLYLLSSLAAHDLGYLTLPALVDRLEKTFDTLEQLERHRGHFFNWYDTRTLRPLQPGYISTVDSGNLLACLLALKQGLREKIEEPIPAPALREGMQDTLALAAEELRALEPPAGAEPQEIFAALDRAIASCQRQLQAPLADLAACEEWLQQMEQRAAELLRDVQRLGSALQEKPVDLERWAQNFAAHLREQRDELSATAPWLSLLREPAGRGAVEADKDDDKRAGSWQAIRRRLLSSGSLADLQVNMESVVGDLAALEEDNHPPAAVAEQAAAPRYAFSTIMQAVQGSIVPELLARLHRLADRAATLAREMDFKLLYNEPRHLFSIGLNLAVNRLDNAHYDLLASEACLTSFLGVARGDVPKRHWFHLGRPLTRAGGSVVLLSWGGTMFEYLMPRLLLRAYPGTLLSESWNACVARQREYGRMHRVPWGISESGFSALD
ncbi:MAG TPA: hypothetical protein VKI17_09165, partial [Gemmataceae bacterium]|nr:hypothetical protein [Gemmataceae bacterium]